MSPITICDPPRATVICQEFDRLEQRVGRSTLEQAHKEGAEAILKGKLKCDFVLEVATNKSLLDRISALLGEDIMLINISRFFCRYGPDLERFTGWHQDVTFLGLDPPKMVTAWYAIDDVDEKNGCLQVVPGSHCGRIRQHTESERRGNILNHNREIALTADDLNTAIHLPLRSGEACLFSGSLIHGAGKITTPRRRAALACRYIQPSTVARNSIVNAGLVVRGQDNYNNYGPIM
ncbi:MAG TPA: phytanoyl-CoA dioxygenase family protein [Mycobacterium sp.]|nr:phytanoyl-CoA dioxygenase family protein [Mycobacterium sp.]HTX96956.1 phytanoyl-CoA dioxygenase family protein [Mycobacterium sp.]